MSAVVLIDGLLYDSPVGLESRRRKSRDFCAISGGISKERLGESAITRDFRNLSGADRRRGGGGRLRASERAPV